jgi:hypothetical protein
VVAALSPSEGERKWATALHDAALIGFVVPLGNVLAPLILWQLGRRRSLFVDVQGREAVNFHLSLLLYAVIGLVLILLPVGIVILLTVGAMLLVLPIVAAVQGGLGREFHYPAAIRFLPWMPPQVAPKDGGRAA